VKNLLSVLVLFFVTVLSCAPQKGKVKEAPYAQAPASASVSTAPVPPRDVVILLPIRSSSLLSPSCPVPSQLATDVSTASQADVISLAGVNPTTCPEVAMTETWSGGKLIFSDSPESPSLRGKLYEDASLPATTGTDYNRVFLYHVSAKTSGNLRFTVLVKNTSALSATLTTQKKGTSGPTTSYLYAGKLGFSRWLASVAGSGVNVPAGATVRLDTTFDTTNVAPSNLLHGIWDYSMTQAHQATVCALNQNDDPLTICPTLSVLTRDSHQRGTFPNADKVYDTSAGTTIDTASEIQQFPLAAGSVNDSNAVGVDATDGSAQVLSGNYGVLYKMHLSTLSTDGKNLGLLLNPRGGQWGGAVWASPGITPGGKFLIPALSGSTGDNTKGAVQGKYSPGAGLTTWAQWMPTGGSALPLRAVAVPF
jgi:hypothetical protein